jgi:hypothetical protein
MLRNRFFWAGIQLLFVTGVGFSAECGSTPPQKVAIDLWSIRTLVSADQRWKFLSIGPHTPDQRALLYIQAADGSRKWLLGWIERDGTAFWSDDSKRLFLRDEYAADDTKIRVFDLTGSVPHEVKGLDKKIRPAVLDHIPLGQSTLWLTYDACFAADDSSTLILDADAPFAPNNGGSGTPLRLRLVVDLKALKVTNVIDITQPSTTKKEK